MNLKFWKSTATGNDFVVLDNFTNDIHRDFSDLSKKLCDRKNGIGADGLLIISQESDYDFEMIYYNSDGSGPVMCGNGGRASLNFVDKYILKKSNYLFITPDGEHKGQVINNDISLTIDGGDSKIEKIEEFRDKPVFLTNTGVPHIVISLENNIDSLDIEKSAPELRKKYDANVNFIQKIGENKWKIRTYERGVEGETLACGTGVTAAGLIVVNEYSSKYPLEFQAKGGVLSLKKENGEIWLGGKAEIVFTGEIEV